MRDSCQPTGAAAKIQKAAEAGLGEMTQKQCSGSISVCACVGPNSGSRQREEQRIQVSAIIYSGARLLLVWLLGSPGQVLGAHLTGRASVLRSRRKEGGR